MNREVYAGTVGNNTSRGGGTGTLSVDTCICRYSLCMHQRSKQHEHTNATIQRPIALYTLCCCFWFDLPHLQNVKYKRNISIPSSLLCLTTPSHLPHFSASHLLPTFLTFPFLCFDRYYISPLSSPVLHKLAICQRISSYTIVITNP